MRRRSDRLAIPSSELKMVKFDVAALEAAYARTAA
jgi:hypothetical protein